MEIDSYNLDLNKIESIPIEEIYRYEVVDIKVKCPNCGLEYTEYNNCDDNWHIIECDKCGKKYKYRYNWL